VERYGFSKDRVREPAMKLDDNIVRARRIASTRLISSIFHSTSPGGAGSSRAGNYGGQLSLVSEVFVLTTWQVLSMQYSVTLSWKIVQRLKFHPDWIPGAPVEVSL
jgi:hypothetical protein